MAQVLAVEVMVVLIVAEVMADGASARSVGVYVVSVLIVLLGKTRPRADVFHIYQGRIPFFLMPMMISACGEILGSADGPMVPGLRCRALTAACSVGAVRG